MKLTRIEGQPVHLVCAGCQTEGIGGSQTYRSAATGEERTPDEWYQDEDPLNFSAYCPPCAAKMVQEDPTRSVHQFFSDTAGNEIEPEIQTDI